MKLVISSQRQRVANQLCHPVHLTRPVTVNWRKRNGVKDEYEVTWHDAKASSGYGDKGAADCNAGLLHNNNIDEFKKSIKCPVTIFEFWE